MPKEKSDKQYTALFLLLFVLVFAFGVVVGCYACTVGDTGDLTVNVVDENGEPLGGAVVTVDSEQKTVTGPDKSATFYNVEFSDSLEVAVEKGSATNTTIVDFDQDGQEVTVRLDTRGGGEGPSKLIV